MADALWTGGELAEIFGPPSGGAMPESISGISIDTRTLQRGDAFFAIKGDRTDGHDYLAQAFATGAALAVVAEGFDGAAAGPLLRVADTLEALNMLGRAGRARSKAQIVWKRWGDWRKVSIALLTGLLIAVLLNIQFMPDKVSATHAFLGNTSGRPRCGQRDLQNVIGFKSLEFGVLAVTCFWMSNGRMVEADIQINNNESWALSLQGCADEAMLEATMTHEAGHVFGLDHVSERRHGRLTMSPYLNGACQNSEASLGSGDVLGLQALY